jgi:dTDP-4-dehydrorhamnose 3,5-epimerase
MKVTFEETGLQDSFTIHYTPFEDARGVFSRIFSKHDFQHTGLNKDIVQINHSVNILKGTIRGMHFQIPPFAEAKLIRCIKGRIYDVIIDIRTDSPTFLKWFGVELSEANRIMMYVPEGFAHGFQTLEDNSELLYHHTGYYTPGYEGGLRFDDPLLGILWKLPPVMVSQRDLSHPLIDTHFLGIQL